MTEMMVGIGTFRVSDLKTSHIQKSILNSKVPFSLVDYGIINGTLFGWQRCRFVC